MICFITSMFFLRILRFVLYFVQTIKMEYNQSKLLIQNFESKLSQLRHTGTLQRDYWSTQLMKS